MTIDNKKGEIAFQLLIGQVTMCVISHSLQLREKMKGRKPLGWNVLHVAQLSMGDADSVPVIYLLPRLRGGA